MNNTQDTHPQLSTMPGIYTFKRRYSVIYQGNVTDQVIKVYYSEEKQQEYFSFLQAGLVEYWKET
jgi:hypothetical protein